MRNSKLKCLSLILSAAIVFSVFPPIISNADIVRSGTCGNNLSWIIDENDVLTISGSGPMYNWGEDESPWCRSNFDGTISSVVFNGNITSIGDYAFLGCSVLGDITIPDTITYIGTGAFCRTPISEVSLPELAAHLSGAESSHNSRISCLECCTAGKVETLSCL